MQSRRVGGRTGDRDPSRPSMLRGCIVPSSAPGLRRVRAWCGDHTLAICLHHASGTSEFEKGRPSRAPDANQGSLSPLRCAGLPATAQSIADIDLPIHYRLLMVGSDDESPLWTPDTLFGWTQTTVTKCVARLDARISTNRGSGRFAAYGRPTAALHGVSAACWILN